MNQKIKVLREKLCLTEKDVSSLLNISTYKYSYFENNEVEIPLEILVLLSKIYGINIDLLLYDVYSSQELIYELELNNFTNCNKADILDKLNFNLLSNQSTKTTYHSIRKVKLVFQNNIIHNIKKLLNLSGLSQQEFSILCEIENNSLDSVLSGKKFIKTSELIKISKYFKIPINFFIDHEK